MMDELVALAGALVFERKRLSESLRRLEGELLRGGMVQELFRSLGPESAERINAELDLMARSLDRFGALTKTLVHSANADRMTSCEPLLLDSVMTVERAASRLERSITVDCKANDVKIDRTVADSFRPILFEILETFVEFCVEPSKERVARGKREKAYFQIEIRPTEEGYRMMAVCDGNGILPPLVSDHGVRLANIGVRAHFEGKPGQWSAWLFHLPSGLGSFRCLPIRVGSRRLCIPLWAVLGSRRLEQGQSRPRGKIYALGDSLGRFEVEAGFETSYGKCLVEVSAGTHAVSYVVDDVLDADEAFMKPLREPFSGKGRFLGVVLTDGDPSLTASENELCLVLNPAYLVYGEAGIARSLPERKRSEGQHAV